MEARWGILPHSCNALETLGPELARRGAGGPAAAAVARARALHGPARAGEPPRCAQYDYLSMC